MKTSFRNLFVLALGAVLSVRSSAPPLVHLGAVPLSLGGLSSWGRLTLILILLVLSAALFGLAHLNLIDAIPLACVGLILAGVYYTTRNAYASMLTHGLFNAFSVVGLLLSPHILKG